MIRLRKLVGGFEVELLNRAAISGIVRGHVITKALSSPARSSLVSGCAKTLKTNPKNRGAAKSREAAKRRGKPP